MIGRSCWNSNTLQAATSPAAMAAADEDCLVLDWRLHLVAELGQQHLFSSDNKTK
jgi:hypothetical protein